MSLGRILGALFGTPGGKGYIGESKVSVVAMFALPRSTYTTFHDVILAVPDGTTQVDHIFVSRFGVFVVETKNMGGWIFGAARDRQWTQVFRNGHKARFQNPLRQNYRHTKAVEAALVGLRLPSGAIRSVVAFVGKAELKTEMPPNVTVGTGFASYVRSFREPIMSESQVLGACSMIESVNLATSAAKHRHHVRDLKAKKGLADPHKCPRCGREMMPRTARSGSNAGGRFLGCSGFPACRYISR